MKIITLTTFSIQNPRIGGAHRVQNIGEVLRSPGYDVFPVGVMDEHAGTVLDGSVPFPPREDLSKYNKLFLVNLSFAEKCGQLFLRLPTATKYPVRFCGHDLVTLG
jgi:hypothetical protein